MIIKEQIMQELEQIPESQLRQVLEFVRSLQAPSQPDDVSSEVWQAYLASKRERKEVYRRLANS
ncbi:hypothetical protein [Pantanalinema sp. GBBB05]|uniref:hypothetical protein n=1 Tax=Pantanalinema sp. GBBB05 TaxID=2604139 RepID=UPI001D4694F7|nr:DUF2281 domain-containing protein [Pantanalinema sp. GBBB05]